MDTIIFKLTFCLSLAFAEFTTENGQWTSQSPATVQDVLDNKTKGTSLNSPEQSMATLTAASPDTILTSMADDNTSTTVTNSSHAQTLESTTAMKPLKSTLMVSKTATAAQTETHSESHTHDSTTTTTAAATTTANSSVVTATFTSVLSTRGPRLNISERNLTIIFSVMLGLFALALVALKIHGWSHKLQFLHESLRNTEDLTSSTEDPDTYRGLSDGHPIYDNVPPPVRQDEAQFSLGFLH